MVVYTKKAMFESNSADGSVRSNAQMETDIITAYEGANNALADSGVDFRIRVVHMAEVTMICLIIRMGYANGYFPIKAAKRTPAALHIVLKCHPISKPSPRHSSD